MQVFHKKDGIILCGVKHALEILRECTGYFDTDGKFVNRYDTIEVEVQEDGEVTENRKPVMRIRGVYRYFGYLETVILGILARQSKIATNAFRVHEAAGGKPVMLFCGRFDVPQVQELDGEAFYVGVEAFNRKRNMSVPPIVATPAQARLWGGKGSGTTAHSLMMLFLRDTVEAMLEFARLMPPDIPRIALVDSNNDCVGDTIRVASAFFERYSTLKKKGKDAEAEQFRLFGVRADTAEDVVDISLQPDGEAGVVPELTRKMREALDGLAARLGYEGEKRRVAEEFFRSVRIVASGGFDEKKIRRFEEEDAKVDYYGVGSAFLRYGQVDYTADVVRVKVGEKFYPMAKVGRSRWENPLLRRVK